MGKNVGKHVNMCAVFDCWFYCHLFFNAVQKSQARVSCPQDSPTPSKIGATYHENAVDEAQQLTMQPPLVDAQGSQPLLPMLKTGNN